MARDPRPHHTRDVPAERILSLIGPRARSRTADLHRAPRVSYVLSMLLNATSIPRKPALQRQLDADQLRFSRELQLQTDAAFEDEQMQAFRMTGLFGEIAGNQNPPLRMPSQS